MFRRAIVRPPGPNFADGLTTTDLGKPDVELAKRQHEAYCRALEQCGVELIRLPASPQHPDSTFVEDTTVLTSHSAILARPGAASRLGEVAEIGDTIGKFYRDVDEIQPPGTLDGGDICEAGSHFFVGISDRTNEDGFRQLARFLAAKGFTSSTVDIRGLGSILHLKSGVAYLDDNNLVVMEGLAATREFSGYNRIVVAPDESYACNCVLVNDRVLMPEGFPRLQAELISHGYRPFPLDVSEFHKMDGGVSCLSLRF